MKIVNQSVDELVLHEGSAQGMVVGVVFLIGGLAAGIALHAKTPMALWIGLAASAVGAGIMLFASSITVNASKSKGQLIYQKKRIVGAQNTNYAIADILRIETRKQWRIENAQNTGNRDATPPQPVLVAQSVIVFKSGKELPLDHQKTSSVNQIGGAVLMSGQGKESAMAYRVAEFLGVPFQEIAPPPMMGTGLNIQF